MEDLARKLAGGLGASGAVLMLAALVSQRFGTRVYFAGGGSANSHASATIVLVSLGLVSWVMALTLLWWANDERARDESARRTTEG